MTFDISHTLQAKSDQINASDLVGSPQLITITAVREGDKEQPIVIDTQENPGRAFKPAKAVRRILAELWGTDASQWIGRQAVIFNDPSVTWAGETVGGVRISHLSHIDGPKQVQVRVARSKRQTVTIQPLQSTPATDWSALIEQAGGDQEALRAVWAQASTEGAPQEVFDTITSIVQTQKEAE